MLAAATELRHAEQVRKYLSAKKLLHPDFLPVKELGFIYFPLAKKAAVPSAKVVLVKFSFPAKKHQPALDDLLKGKLTVRELTLLPRSQEIVGNLLILEIPPELEKKEKMIAEAFLQANKHVATIVRKQRMHGGVYRLRKVRILAGKKTKEAVHQENGVKLKIHLENTYFSARLANERLRIAQQVKPGEEVLVMFSGAAPYPLVIAKRSPAKMVYGIEINPLAHRYAIENVALNKLEKKIRIFQGDVREVVPKIRKKFDRVVMPLPKTGEEFLDVTLRKAKPGAIVHLYAFLEEKYFAAEAKKIKEICKQQGHPVRVLRTVPCGQFSPYVFRVCFDLKVLR
ncbi:MAG: class I SAM-dependent methyltransferase family protein [Nanoarchaeota archaeon]|nr:class I SAM-dependent methyltransferase family protein [Nanoarchaeota archaeon]